MADKEKVASRYDKWNSFYDKIDNFPVIGRPQKKWKSQAIESLDMSGDERVLDIGTGTGQILTEISSYLDKGKVVGTDISKGMLRRSKRRIEKERIGEVASVRYDDIENSQFPDNYFDRIIATFTFTTLPNPKKAAEECARILKDDGRMIVLDTGKPPSKTALLFFIPMMLSAKLFGRTHMDRDIGEILNSNFDVEKINSHMIGMVYTLKCEIKK
ncbi:MAG: methyltransferase domain-containing protein [Candidatus Saliniplasma sp.]